MFIPSYNPLVALTNYLARAELSGNLQENFEKSQVPSQTSLRDHIFHYLIEKGVIDEYGCLNVGFQHSWAPGLKIAQLERINELLTKPFVVKSKDDLFEISITLQELFTALDIHSIEIVGGGVFWILGAEYVEEICNLLSIPAHLVKEELFADFKTQASDIDIRVPYIKDINFFKNAVRLFLANKLPEKFNDQNREQLIFEQAFIKYFTLPSYAKDRYSIVSFGNRKDFNIDLLFVDHLKRHYLFKSDAVKIVITGLKTQDQKSTIQSASKTGSILESMILRMTKILNSDDLEQIDVAGCAMVFSNLTKGWRYIHSAFDNVLLNYFFKSGEFFQLTKILNNHFQSDGFAATVLCFNVCSFMTDKKNLILNATHQLLPHYIENNQASESALKLFAKCMMHLNVKDQKREVATQIFEWITAYYQIFGSLTTCFGQQNREIEVFKTVIHQESFFQFKFISGSRSLYISVIDNLSKGLENFKNQKIPKSLLETFQLLSRYFVFYPEKKLEIALFPTEIHLNFAPKDLKFAIDSLEHVEVGNNFFNQIGFYLLCHAGIGEQNSEYLTHLLLKLPYLLENEKSPVIRKNLLFTLLAYWMNTNQRQLLLKVSEKVETFYETLLSQDKVLKSFCLAFCGVEIPRFTGLILSIWKTHHELFDEETSLKLIETIKEHDPYAALTILKELSETRRCETKTYLEILGTIFSRLPKKEILKLTLELHKQFPNLKSKSTTQEIVSFYLKMLDFFCVETKDKIIPTLLLFVDEYIDHKNVLEALSLMEHMEQLFPGNSILNEAEKWKKIVLCFNEKQSLIKLELMTKKSEILSPDESMSKLAEELCLFLFNNKKDNPLISNLKLIEVYRLKSLKIILCLRDTFKVLKNKNLCETTFLMLQEMGLSLFDLSPLFHPLNLVKSALCLNFLTQYEEILAQIVDKNQKKELIRDFMSGFLNFLPNKLCDPLIISSSFLFLENELKNLSPMTPDQQNEIDFKYLRAFTPTLDHENLNIWTKLNALAKSAKKSEINELLQLFINVIAVFKDDKEAKKIFEPQLLKFLKNIHTKATSLQMVPFTEFISEYNSPKILKFHFYFASKIIKSCPTEKPDQLKGSYLQFKPFLKKLIDFAIEKSATGDLVDLISIKFLNAKEYYFYRGKFSKTLFSEPHGTLNADYIEIALKHYVENIESIDESPEFKQENLKSAINYLTDLLFVHKDGVKYFDQFSNLTTKMLNFVDNKYEYIELENYFNMLPKKTKLHIKINKETLAMRQKIFHFYLHLTESFSLKLMKYNYQFHPLLADFSAANICHISYMIPFIEKKKEIISATINYCYISLFLPCGLSDTFQECTRHLVKMMEEQNYFTISDSVEECEKNFELHLINRMLEFTPKSGKKVSEVYLMLSNKKKASMILDIVKKIKAYKGCLAIVAALQFLTDHATFLYAHLPVETKNLEQELFKADKATTVEASKNT